MTMLFEQALTGISGILVTPYDVDGDISPERLTPIIDRALTAGVHLPVVNGNTSEFYALSTDEACRMVAAVTEIVKGRAPVLAGIGRALPDALRLAKASVQAGASALMIHQPPDPFVAPRGIVDYVRAIRDESDGLPLVLYLRNDALGTDDITALCAVPGVQGVKWAIPHPVKLAEAMAACAPSLTWVGGLAELWASAFYAVGARGFTSGLINVWPERSVAIHRALETGNDRLVRALIAEIQIFEEIRGEELNGVNVTGVKAALQAIGHDCGPTRAPSAWPLNGNQSERLYQFLTANDLIPEKTHRH